MTSMEPHNLLYRNQFVLGPAFMESFPHWEKLSIGSSLKLTTHPDLNVYRAINNDRSITLLGFIVDPENPSRTDAEIIDHLVNTAFNSETFFEKTFRFGGRWILIINDGQKVILFNDPTGLRQVFHTDSKYVEEFWCASQPGMIAQILDLEMDKQAVAFFNSYEVRKNPEFRFPYYASPYKEIRHMLPNHSLDLQSALCRRIWPTHPLEKLSFEEALDKSLRILKGLMRAASNRYELALSLTAGLDSRIILAVSREISDKLSYMTVRQIDRSEEDPDVVIPSILLPQLGLKHNLIKSSKIIDERFMGVFLKNVPLPHSIYAPDAYAILNYFQQKKIVVTGSACEIARWSERSHVPEARWNSVTPFDLSKIQRMGQNRFAVDHFASWLADLGEIYNFNTLDLFDWEQGHGNWLAMCQLEFDAAWKEIFTPFNCRSLLTTLLSVEDQYRKPPGYRIFREMILQSWPELLDVPINPGKKKNLVTITKRYTPAFIKKSVKRLRQKEGS